MGLSRTHWSRIDAARGGDDAAVRALVEKYRGPVVRFIERRGAKGEAEDLAQEVFLRLLAKGSLARATPEKGTFRGFLLAIARHVIASHRREQGAKKRGGGAVKTRDDLDEVVAARSAGDDGFDRDWLRNLLELGLARLAREHPSYHEALRRCVVESASQADAAAAMGCTPDQVRNHVHRGRKKLIAFVQQEVWSYCSSPEEYAAELELLGDLLPPDPS